MKQKQFFGFSFISVTWTD